ncbi:hypothetical protein NUW54_g14617 [Trametes sanguinea]|uniref:Uncharacterized protein n=1 Tax=Trametes sanguinea TaxID=158606 RepID=A0ACC1MB88_9APHY|nr:hypothetical protein NUW54_g14617 [Trametes sanguinea]
MQAECRNLANDGHDTQDVSTLRVSKATLLTLHELDKGKFSGRRACWSVVPEGAREVASRLLRDATPREAEQNARGHEIALAG